VGVEPATYAVQSAEPEEIDLVVIFALLTYMGNEKMQEKNKTNTDPKDPTTNQRLWLEFAWICALYKFCNNNNNNNNNP